MQQGFFCLPNPPINDLHRAFVDKQDVYGNECTTQNARGAGQPVQPATGAAMFVVTPLLFPTLTSRGALLTLAISVAQPSRLLAYVTDNNNNITLTDSSASQ